MDYFKRLNNLQAKFKEYAIDAFLVTHPIDIYYMTGINLSTGMLLAAEQFACLIVDGRYFEICKKKCPFEVVLGKEDALWGVLGKDKQLGFDSEALSYQAFMDLEKESLKHSCRLVPLKGIFQNLRMIKDQEEIACLKKAAALGALGFDFLFSQLKIGISEEELSRELELFWIRNGGMGISFQPIVAFGSNSSMPHYRAGKALLQKGDIVLIDIGVILDHYHSDMTRVIFFGETDPRLREIHSIVVKAYEAALLLCKPNTLISGLDRAARSVIEKSGYGEKFTHSLGHGVGLEIHEYPTLKKDPQNKDAVLAEGMVITIEPGIYLPQVGGVRIEDTVAITKDGYENLTNRKTYFEVKNV